MPVDGGSPEDVGWQIDVDGEAEELRLEHADSGSVYRLDAEGGLRVPGQGEAGLEDAGEALADLQSTLESALEAEQRDGDASAATENLQSSCRVECDQQGQVVIESDSKISLDAPVVDIAADAQLEATSNGTLTLQGALIQLN